MATEGKSKKSEIEDSNETAETEVEEDTEDSEDSEEPEEPIKVAKQNVTREVKKRGIRGMSESTAHALLEELRKSNENQRGILSALSGDDKKTAKKPEDKKGIFESMLDWLDD